MRVQRRSGDGLWIPDSCRLSDTLTILPKSASSGGGAFNFNDGFGKLFLCSMYNTQTQNPESSITINACSTISLLLKGLEIQDQLEHPLAVGKRTHIITWRYFLNKIVSHNW